MLVRCDRAVFAAARACLLWYCITAAALAPMQVSAGPLASATARYSDTLRVQASNDLKAHMDKHRGKAYSERLADFHLLLWLSTHLHWQDEDIAQIVEAVKEKEPIMEGYTLMIDSMAGM